MALTWKDIKSIVGISNQVLNTLDYGKIKELGEEGYFTEILNQFNRQKEKEEDYILDSMIEAMTDICGVTKEELISNTRRNDVCAARYFIWERLHNKHRWSYSRLARTFNRTHATVMEGVKRVELYNTVPTYQEERQISEDFERVLTNKNNIL